MLSNLSSLVIATGSNIGDKKNNLLSAKQELSKKFLLLGESRIYESAPVDYLAQDDFYNMALEFKLPADLSPDNVLTICKEIENKLGRIKLIDKGPRNIDIDIIFYGDLQMNSDQLILPHPHWLNRSFVVLPILDLPCAPQIRKNYAIPQNFSSWAIPIN